MAPPPCESLRVFGFGRAFGVPFETSGPFPLKLVTWLRMAQLPYTFVVADDPRKGPKGKSPWIELDGVTMGDSSLIIAHLADRFGIELDGHLDARRRALAISVQRMLEEHYHQCYEHQLFLGRGGAARLGEFTSGMPIPVRWILPAVLRRKLVDQLHARGMGRHDEKVVLDQGRADLDALDELVADQPYALGDRPSSLDACVFGFLGVSVYVEGDNPLFRHAAAKPNLMRYCEGMRAQYFPETLDLLPPLDVEASPLGRAVVA